MWSRRSAVSGSSPRILRVLFRIAISPEEITRSERSEAAARRQDCGRGRFVRDRRCSGNRSAAWGCSSSLLQAQVRRYGRRVWRNAVAPKHTQMNPDVFGMVQQIQSCDRAEEDEEDEWEGVSSVAICSWRTSDLQIATEFSRPFDLGHWTPDIGHGERAPSGSESGETVGATRGWGSGIRTTVILLLAGIFRLSSIHEHPAWSPDSDARRSSRPFATRSRPISSATT